MIVAENLAQMASVEWRAWRAIWHRWCVAENLAWVKIWARVLLKWGAWLKFGGFINEILKFDGFMNEILKNKILKFAKNRFLRAGIVAYKALATGRRFLDLGIVRWCFGHTHALHLLAVNRLGCIMRALCRHLLN